MGKEIIGVVLLNMGGPERQEDVASFLTNIFSDRNIIRLHPAFLQKLLARFIARRRAPYSQKMYQQIGGGSPLRQITEAQSAALEESLRQTGGDYHVRIAMRYWHPRAEQAISELARLGAQKLIALPLYPQYSRTTTGSSLADLRQAQKAMLPDAAMVEISAWPDHPGYIAALANCLAEGLRQGKSGRPRLLYSAHSLPRSVIDGGDLYLSHLKRTIAALEKQTGIEGTLCFQSRGSPMRWLQPETGDIIDQCARAGEKELLIMPISFVSDHIETLYEIGILFAQQAKRHGMNLVVSPSLNTTTDFIACLRELVLAAQS